MFCGMSFEKVCSGLRVSMDAYAETLDGHGRLTTACVERFEALEKDASSPPPDAELLKTGQETVGKLAWLA